MCCTFVKKSPLRKCKQTLSHCLLGSLFALSATPLAGFAFFGSADTTKQQLTWLISLVDTFQATLWRRFRKNVVVTWQSWVDPIQHNMLESVSDLRGRKSLAKEKGVAEGGKYLAEFVGNEESFGRIVAII